jgi:hypothetical protein
MYTSETWTLNKTTEKKIETINNRDMDLQKKLIEFLKRNKTNIKVNNLLEIKK